MTPGVFAGPGGMKKAAHADGGNIKKGPAGTFRLLVIDG